MLDKPTTPVMSNLIAQSKLFPFAKENAVAEIQGVAAVGLRVLKGQGLGLNYVSSQNVAVHK